MPSSEKQKPQQLKFLAGKPSSSSSLKPSTEPANKEARKRGHARAVNDDLAALKKQKQWQEERKIEKGKGKATMADFEACIRVGQTGAETFRELQELIAGKMTDRLRGKIFALESENRYIDGELICTCRELKTYRYHKWVAYSEDNRSLKAELEKVKGVQQQLDEANAKVSEHAKSVAEIPTLKADHKALQDWRVAAEVRKKKDAELVEQLKKDNAELTKKMALVAITGFDRCLNMAVILETTLNTDLLDAKYKDENRKIVYQGQVIYDPASVTSRGVEDEANLASVDQGAELEGEREAEKDAERVE